MKTYNYIIVTPCSVGTLYFVRLGMKPARSLSASEAKKYTTTSSVKKALNRLPQKEREAACAVPFEIVPEPPRKPSKLKNYVVRLNIFCGEYEKSTTHLVMHKRSKEAAIKVAIRCECHDTDTSLKPDSAGSYKDGCGEFCYSVHSVVEVTPAEAEVLRKYL